LIVLIQYISIYHALHHTRIQIQIFLNPQMSGLVFTRLIKSLSTLVSDLFRTAA